MEKVLFILEHEILKAILEKNSIIVGKAYKDGTPQIPFSGRDYHDCSLHFGTLVDVLNNPGKYVTKKSLSGVITTKESINVNQFNFKDVSDAIEVLVYNGHVRINPEQGLDHNGSQQIFITLKGAVDFRAKYYWKEYDKIRSIETKYEIEKRDLGLKKYWYLVEAAKYIMGGVLGSAITWFFTRK